MRYVVFNASRHTTGFICAVYKSQRTYFPANAEISDTSSASAYAGLRTKILLRIVRIMYCGPSSFAFFFVL